MSDAAKRYAKIADAFTERVRAVPPNAWDNPAPCDGWVARDVVKHLVEWVPGFCQSFAGIELASGPSPDEDPVGAWEALDRAIRDAMARADATTFETPMGKMTFAHYDIAAGAAPLHEHEHEQEEVWNVVEGELELIVGGVARRMRAGTAAIVPPHTLHSVRPIGPCRAVIVDYPLRTSLPGLNRSP